MRKQRRVRNLTKVERAEICPCGSGKTYGTCCWGKAFEFQRDSKGDIYKRVPLPPEGVELLRAKREHFRRIFGRNPGPGDPLFLEQYFISSADLENDFETAAEAAGIRPELIYASMKTGLIVTKEFSDRLTNAELREWQEAIDEYFEKVETGQDTTPPRYSERGKTDLPAAVIDAYGELLIDLYAVVCHLGSFIRNAPSMRTYDSKTFLQYYFVTRTLDTIRTIHHWFTKRYSEDVWMLIRVVYEAYIHLLYLRRVPAAERYFFAIHGIWTGTHRYLQRANGKPDYRQIVDIKTEEKFTLVSKRNMASASETETEVELFDVLYARLSSYSHAGLDPSLQFVDPLEGFKMHEEGDPFGALIWVSIVNALLIQELRKVHSIKKRTADDLSRLADRLRSHVQPLLSTNDLNSRSEPFRAVYNRFRYMEC